MRITGLVMTIAALLSATAFGGTLQPRLADGFYPLPDTQAVIHLETKDIPADSCLAYKVYDYWEEFEFEGSTVVGKDGAVDVPVKLKAGYHEITFPDTGQTFGIGCLDKVHGAADEFFCVDAGMSWTGNGDPFWRSWLPILARQGIATVRERLTWSQVNPAKDLFQFEQHSGYDIVRNSFAEFGLKALEVFHDTPAHCRGNNVFPQDTINTAEAWAVLARRWHKGWGAVEVWNEPNCFGLPGGQYVPMAKAIAWAIHEEKMGDVLVVGGCYNPGASSVYLETCAQNGLLDVSDAISFHLYAAPSSMQKYVKSYRDLFRKFGKDSMPLWCSESGSPWQHLAERRPPIEEDNRCATMTTMRGIEGRACGLAKFFPFFLNPHREGPIEWGITGPHRTPLRQWAAWLQATKILRNKTYLGDLKVAAGEVSLARVFGDDNEAIVVLYGASKDAVKLDIPVKSIEGVDGRALCKTKTGLVPMRDNLTYVRTGRVDVAGKLLTDTETMRLFKISQQPAPAVMAKPVVLQPMMDSENVTRVSEFGYDVDTAQASACKVGAKASNFTDKNRKVTVQLMLPQGCNLVEGKPVETIDVPAKGTVSLSWKVDLSSALAVDRKAAVVVTATDESGKTADRIFMPFRAISPRTVYVVPRSEQHIVIDADVTPGEWDPAPAITDLTIVNPSGADEKITTADLSARARFQWDEAGLYYLIEVTDQKHVQDGNAGVSWQQDSVQVAVHQANSELDQNRFEWGLFLGPKGAESTTTMTSTNEPLSKESHVAINRDEKTNRTVYEGMFAWVDLGSMKVILNKEKMRLGLTFVVNDSDGEIRKWAEWSPGIAGTKDSSEFPELILDSGAANVVLSDMFSDSDFTSNPKWNVTDANPKTTDWSIINDDGNLRLQAIEADGARISVDLPALEPGTPVTVTMILQTKGWTGPGYEIRMALYEAETAMGYAAWCASGTMYGGSTGFVFSNYDENWPALGLAGAHLMQSADPQRLTLTYDPLTELLSISHGPLNGAQRIVAQCTGRYELATVDRFEIWTPSTWGAPPRVFDDIVITGTKAKEANGKKVF